MANYMEATLLQEFLIHILSPIYRITEDDTIRDQQMGEYPLGPTHRYPHSRSTDELKATAVELQDLVQRKVGTTKFAVTYNKIRQAVSGVQRERRTARVTKACFKV
jgi:U3 small nucleolar RNA-associated protein 20